MANCSPTTKLAEPKQYVKSEVNTQLPLFSDTLIHHSREARKYIVGSKDKVWRETRYYGVSSDYRILTRGLYIKQFDNVRDFFQNVLGFTTAKREVILRLISYWSHYGICYPTVARLCQEPGCSKATAWRVLRELQDDKLLQVVQRYLTPYRRQISNLYLFHKLFLLIARYLAEHGVQFWEKWLKPYLSMPGSQFWGLFAFSFSSSSGSSPGNSG